MNSMKPLQLISALAVAAWASGGASGQITHHNGFDRIGTTSIWDATNASNAEAGWLNDAAAMGATQTVDFESATVGVYGWTMVIAPGVTAYATHDFFYPHDLAVASGPTNYGPLNGFNTTSGGSHHLRYLQTGGSVVRPGVTLKFDRPISALSLFITGEGNTPFWDWGSTLVNGYSIGDTGNPYWPSTAQPNARFGGFVDPSGSYTSVDVQFRYYSSTLSGSGSFSLDDIRWVYTVPAPAATGLLACAALGVLRRNRRD